MGSVELAIKQENNFRRLYAVKRLHPHLRTDPQFEAMFMEEARIAGLIQHPNVVAVTDVGRDESGPFLVMDFVDGVTLNTLVHAPPERMPLQIGIRIGIEIAKGLDAAHSLTTHDGFALNLVHRDLSPHNVLVGFDGSVRITDFGIAKALGSEIKTSTGVLKGKVSYMSPEQLRFEEIDARSDLFSLGVLLFELLTGERLYRNDSTMQGARKILSEAPPDLGEERDDAPPELVALMFRLLAKDPAKRPGAAAEVVASLEEILSELVAVEGVQPLREWVTEATGDRRQEQQSAISAAVRQARVRQSKKSARQRRRPYYLGAAIVVIALGTVIVWSVKMGADAAQTATVTDPDPDPDPVERTTVIGAEPIEEAVIAEPRETVPEDQVEEVTEAVPAVEPTPETAAPATQSDRRRSRRRRRVHPAKVAATRESRWVEWGDP